MGATAISAAIPWSGCCREPGLRVEDPDIGRPSHPQTFVAIAPLQPGRAAELEERLRSHVFPHPQSGVHFARLVLLPDDGLLLSMVYDDHRATALDFLVKNAEQLDRVLELCEGWPASGAADRAALDKWLKRWDVPTLLLYSAFSHGSEPAIHESVELRDGFLRTAAAIRREPERAESLWHAFELDNRARMMLHEEQEATALSAYQLVAPDEQHPFTMIYTVRAKELHRLRATLGIGEWAIEHFHIHPLRQIPTVHYARFAELPGGRMLFLSVYDGDWEQYVQDFAARIPKKLDKVWGGAVGYPKRGAADAPALGTFLQTRRVSGDFFYIADKHRTVKEIQKSLELGRHLLAFSRHVPQRSQGVVEHVDRFLREHQLLLL